MTKPSQTESGKAFEYCLAEALSQRFTMPFINNSSKDIAQKAFSIHSETAQVNMQEAADKAALFFGNHDAKLGKGEKVTLQIDKQGADGDVRDIVVSLSTGDAIGLSAKHRHDAIKHSRLSDKIDFGLKWTGYPCTKAYMNRIKHVFEDLRNKKKDNILFRDIQDKENRYYLPVLIAFEDELKRLCEDHGSAFVKNMFQYLLGKHDYYKVVKENKCISIQSCNINGSLPWGKNGKYRIG